MVCTQPVKPVTIHAKPAFVSLPGKQVRRALQHKC